MKFYNLCILVLELGLASLVVSLQSNNKCPSSLQFSTNLKVFRGICYQFVPIEKDWFEARDYCKKYGGHLAAILDSETNDFLKNELNSLWWRNNGIWIGLNDLENDGHFTWTSKIANLKLGSWTNWGRGHPGAFLSSYRDCIRMVRNSGWKWHETPCKFPGFQYRFICQYETVQPVSIGSRINIAIKPSYGTTSSISYNVKGNYHYEPPVASLKQGPDAVIGGSQNEDHDSKMWQVILMCMACLLVILAVAIILVYRRRKRQSDKPIYVIDMKNSSLEKASCLNAKVENIYIDESMQKFLKSKETDKHESIYEEIPYDLERADIAKV